MQKRIEVDEARLRELWADDDRTRAEVARELGLTAKQLERASARYALPPRSKRHRAFSIVDPTPEEIEAACERLRANRVDPEPQRVEIRRYGYDLNSSAFVTVTG
jgi:hypothetical protein